MKFAGKSYPDPRAAKPRRGTWWIINFIPGVQCWARFITIGFYKNGSMKTWSPVMRGPMIRISRFGIDVIR